MPFQQSRFPPQSTHKAYKQAGQFLLLRKRCLQRVNEHSQRQKTLRSGVLWRRDEIFC